MFYLKEYIQYPVDYTNNMYIYLQFWPQNIKSSKHGMKVIKLTFTFMFMLISKHSLYLNLIKILKLEVITHKTDHSVIGNIHGHLGGRRNRASYLTRKIFFFFCFLSIFRILSSL